MNPVSIIEFFKSNWKSIIIGLLLISAVVYVETLRVEVAQKDTKIVSLQADNVTLTTNNDTLKTSIATQNKAIETMSASAVLAQKNFDALHRLTSQQSAALNTQLSAILHEKKPQTCGEAIQYLISAAKGYPK